MNELLSDYTLSTRSQVAILIGHGFSEESLIPIFKVANRQQLCVYFISLLKRPYAGQLGLLAAPHLIVTAWIQAFDAYPELMIIPGPLSHATSLLLDPRILNFIENTLVDGGRIATTAEIKALYLSIDTAYMVYAQQFVNLTLP